MTAAEPTVEVTDQRDASRYEIHVDGARAGLLAYELRPPRIVLVHTEIDDAFEGRGLASTLVRFALDDARARGLEVVARCPYVARYMVKHPEYADLVRR